MSSVLPYLGDALVVLGVFVMTLGVYGATRMPDTYTRLHAMAKVVFLGVVALCISTVVTADAAVISRAFLVGTFLLITTPISSLVIGRAAFLREERMKSPEAFDDSGRDLNRPARD